MPTKCDRIVAIDSATSLHPMYTLRPHDVHSWRGRFPRVRCGGCACARATTYHVIGGDDDDDDDVARLLPPPPRRICVIGRRRRRRRAHTARRPASRSTSPPPLHRRRSVLRLCPTRPLSNHAVEPRAHRRLPADNAELVMKFDEPRASTSPSSTRSLRPPATSAWRRARSKVRPPVRRTCCGAEATTTIAAAHAHGGVDAARPAMTSSG